MRQSQGGDTRKESCRVATPARSAHFVMVSEPANIHAYPITCIPMQVDPQRCHPVSFTTSRLTLCPNPFTIRENLTHSVELGGTICGAIRSSFVSLFSS